MSGKQVGPIVVLTGAGISRESGLATFRDPDGIWARVRIEDVATLEAFQRDPARVHAFYNARRKQLLSGAVRPNAAHAALVELERRLADDLFLLVTQNIDDLHGRAGSRNLVHMHGELLKARCARSGRVVECRHDLIVEERCTLFIAIGTSGQVYPAAGFVEQARRAGARAVELNAERTELSEHFDEHLTGPATETVPAFVGQLLEARGACVRRGIWLRLLPEEDRR